MPEALVCFSHRRQRLLFKLASAPQLITGPRPLHLLTSLCCWLCSALDHSMHDYNGTPCHRCTCWTRSTCYQSLPDLTVLHWVYAWTLNCYLLCIQVGHLHWVGYSSFTTQHCSYTYPEWLWHDSYEQPVSWQKLILFRIKCVNKMVLHMLARQSLIQPDTITKTKNTWMKSIVPVHTLWPLQLPPWQLCQYSTMLTGCRGASVHRQKHVITLYSTMWLGTHTDTGFQETL